MQHLTYRKEGQVTRSHRNEDRGGEHRWTFNGVEYPTRKLMCEARRAEYVVCVQLVVAGLVTMIFRV